MRLRKKNLLSNFMFFDPRSLTKLRNECDYWKAKAEGEKIAREAVQEENEKLINSLDRLVEQHESLSDENETLENNFKEFMYTADYNERQFQDRKKLFLKVLEKVNNLAWDVLSTLENERGVVEGQLEYDYLKEMGEIIGKVINKEGETV